MELDPKLQAKGISLSFKNVVALTDVSIDVRGNEILSIIGPNGAGKSSLLNCLCGFYKPDRGEIYFEGKDITRIPIRKRVTLGLGRTFQSVQLFGNMTALDNILTGREIHMKSNFLKSMLYWPRGTKDEDRHRLRAEEIIRFLEIESIRTSVVNSLGYGMRKRVDLGRAMALEPTLLLMDEPMAGMNLEEKEDMCRFIMDLRSEKEIAVVIVEHDMEVVMDISDRIVVLEWGSVIAEGTPAVVAADPDVIRAYLGEG